MKEQHTRDWSNAIDVSAAILLALATVLTAWCAYQSSRWSGVQATAFAEASSARIEASKEYEAALLTRSLDTQMFLSWADFTAQNSDDGLTDDQIELAVLYLTNFMRPEFVTALNAWLESDPQENPSAFRTPFEDPAYNEALFSKSDEMKEKAEAKFLEATDANQTSDDYVLATVLFASVLFFAGIAPKFGRIAVQVGLLGFGVFVLGAGVLQLSHLPVH